MRNFKSIFKRCICAATAGILALSLVGCSKGGSSSDSNSNDSGSKKAEIKNLDFTNAATPEHTPNSGEWYTLKLNRIPKSPDIAKYMKQIADALGFSDFDEQNIIYNVYDGDSLDGDFSIDEMTDDYFDHLHTTRCFTDDFYLDIWQNTMVIFNNRKLIRDTVSDPKIIDGATFGGWIPGAGGKVIKSYDVSDNEGLKDKYILNGKEVSILDVMENAKKFMNEEQPVQNNSEIFKYEPIEIEVYKQTDTSYGYYFVFQTYFDGVPIDATYSGDIPESPNSLFSLSTDVYMLDPSMVAYYWTSPLYCSELVSKEPCEIKVDFDEAAAIVSEKLSQEHVFTVNRAELIYCVDAIDPTAEYPTDEQRYGIIKPMWQFTITNTGMQYATIYVYVDAVSGEMFIQS